MLNLYIHCADSFLLTRSRKYVIFFSKESVVMYPILNEYTMCLVITQINFVSLTLTVNFYITHCCQTGVSQIVFQPSFCLIILFSGQTE